MDDVLSQIAKTLFTWSELEEDRIRARTADPKNVEAFKNLDSMIAHSLKVPNLVKTHSPEGNALKIPQTVQRPFHDEAIMKRLLQHRDKIPLSARILRPGNSSSS